jgi:hypothetical protein
MNNYPKPNIISATCCSNGETNVYNVLTQINPTTDIVKSGTFSMSALSVPDVTVLSASGTYQIINNIIHIMGTAVVNRTENLNITLLLTPTFQENGIVLTSGIPGPLTEFNSSGSSGGMATINGGQIQLNWRSGSTAATNNVLSFSTSGTLNFT